MRFATDYYITIIIVSPKRKICEVARADQATKIKKRLESEPFILYSIIFFSCSHLEMPDASLLAQLELPHISAFCSFYLSGCYLP